MGDVEYNVQLFQEMITCVHNIYCSEFDEEYTPVRSTAGDWGRWLLAGLFAMGGRELEAGGIPGYRYEGKPVFSTNSLGMAWISDMLVEDGRFQKLYVLGPVFLDDDSVRKVGWRMDHLEVSVFRKKEFMDVINRLPVMPMLRFKEYGLMLHYCLYGEKISLNEYEYMENEERVGEASGKERESVEDSLRFGEEGGSFNHATYEMEQKLLSMVEEGNLGYKDVKKRLVSFGNVGKISGGDFVHELRRHAVIHTALCTRAAIRGGLNPETAYTLSDRYILRMEQCKTLGELQEINEGMVDDFVHRVHRLKMENGISLTMQNACEYISLNLEENLDVHDIAAHFGYTDYYFTKRFKRETGVSVKEFIRDRKLEKACELLKDTNANVQEISERLGFKTHSYFGKLFREKMGVSPSEYREGLGK